ncbi:MAG: RimJ/RimL family protein N-acetyltransferase, partial [Candidatus Marinamargulisbacteria bacterium]
EYSETGLFIGYVGLMRVDFEARFTPAVEIGWRLASAFWGNGYATEAAKAALDHGFNRLQLQEVVSFTTKSNMRSQRVMEKIGPKHTSEDDFDHPKLDADSPLSRHVLYRLTKNQYDLFR